MSPDKLLPSIIRSLLMAGVFLFCITDVRAIAQGFVYVNTDKLILRSKPDADYVVYAILHAPCKLKLGPVDEGYSRNKTANDKFYRVTVSYYKADRRSNMMMGWVDKRYVVTDKKRITVKNIDTGLELNLSEVPLISWIGSEHNPNRVNAAWFMPPEYKGGDSQATPAGRVYHKEPKGGCYYYSPAGKKVYTDKSNCNGK